MNSIGNSNINTAIIYRYASAAAFFGAGLIGGAASGLLFNRSDPSGPFEFSQTSLYKRVEPYVPRTVDSALKIIEKKIGWDITAVAVGALASGCFGGIYSAAAFISGTLLAKSCPKAPHSPLTPSVERSFAALDYSSGEDIEDNCIRKKIAVENEAAAAKGKYTADSGKEVALFKGPQSGANRILAVNSDKDLKEIKTKANVQNTKDNLERKQYFRIAHEDGLDVYQRELNEGRKPVLAVSVNLQKPGGGYLDGDKGEEEKLLRRIPDAFSCLKIGFKKAQRHSCIYVKGASCARNKNYELIENPASVDLIFSGPPNLNEKLPGFEEDSAARGIFYFMDRLNAFSEDVIKDINQKILKKTTKSLLHTGSDGRVYLDYMGIMSFEELISNLPPDVNIIKLITATEGIDKNVLREISKFGYERYAKDKIYWQIETAAAAGHDSIIIPAWGCGKFCNRPEIIAKYYKAVYDKYFKGSIKMIFAIPEKRNFEPFKKIFR